MESHIGSMNRTVDFYDAVVSHTICKHPTSFRDRLHVKTDGRSSVCIHLLVLLWMLPNFISPVYSVASSVSKITGFTSNQRRIFTDDDDNVGDTFFHYINFDPFNSSQLYIGALDYVYRLSADNINISAKRSDNITKFSNFSKIYSSAVESCTISYVQKSQPNYQCRNHVRGILPKLNSKELYVCATGSYSPQEFYLDATTLQVLRIGYDQTDQIGAGSGITKCPYDPDTNHTIIFVDENHGNPNNRSAIYSSLLVGAGYDYAIYRSAIMKNRSSPIEIFPLRSESGPAFGELSYIASYEIDQYVYFFFRELAVEFANCGHIHYARVARVCKNDKGGSLQRNQFLTYVKARLNCSLGTADIPVYFNELSDVQYDDQRRIFYGLFMSNLNGLWGSAVCQFGYTDVRNKFDYGQFFAQETANALWTVTPDSIVPRPRPSICQTDTLSSSITVQSFALSHTLMFGTIDQMTSSPLFYNQRTAYSHLAIDLVNVAQQFTILFLYSAAVPDEIVRVVEWNDETGKVQFRKISVIKPFVHNPTTLHDMKIYRVNGKTWIYLVTDDVVIQLSVDLCSQYYLCTDCVKDPYCGWNVSSNVCQSYQSGLIQGVTEPSSLSICRAECMIGNDIVRALPGTASHLCCSSLCSPESTVIWTFQPKGAKAWQMVPVTSNPDYIQTRDNGLVLLNVTRYDAGTFRCSSNEIVLAEHNVTLIGCSYGEDIREIWIREYTTWCNAFDQYRAQYNNWLCLREKCLKANCIPSDAAASCGNR